MTKADDLMVEQMLIRRTTTRPERRHTSHSPNPQFERRRTCSFCFQPGDHHSPDDCLRALTRVGAKEN